MTGDEGASVVFGPQKGASTPDLVSNLDNNLKLYAEVIFNNLGVNVDKFPGAGAAGGMGAAFFSVFLIVDLFPEQILLFKNMI